MGQSAAVNYLVASECGMMGRNAFEAAQILGWAEHIKELNKAYTDLVPPLKEAPRAAVTTAAVTTAYRLHTQPHFARSASLVQHSDPRINHLAFTALAPNLTPIGAPNLCNNNGSGAPNLCRAKCCLRGEGPVGQRPDGRGAGRLFRAAPRRPCRPRRHGHPHQPEPGELHRLEVHRLEVCRLGVQL